LHSRIHLICCGSLYSLMTKIFQDSKEPLFGRADNRLNLQPLKRFELVLKRYQHFV